MVSKSWGGRFDEALAQVAIRYSASIDVDKRLYEQDVRASIAHANMLAAQGIITDEDAQAIAEGLTQISSEIRAGNFEFSDALEDVHMNIEAALRERIGDAGGRLHTARSRNDQVATDMRLWTRKACHTTQEKIMRLLLCLADRADDSIDMVMPGYTHLQRAQPVRMGHHLLAWAEMLERDHARLADAAKRMNESPLGAAALAGTTFPIDRDATAAALGFDRAMRNSLDAVASRDFLVEATAALACCAVHLSRISEELVLWASQEFAFVTMSDAYSTGSSIMPQKKNPDMAELARGKTGRVVGDLVSLLVMLKGLPLAYNRDMQEDKEPVFDAFDTVDDTLDVLQGTIGTMSFRPKKMKAALSEGFVEATEIADWLADRGLPFRQAHHVAGRLVARCAASDRTLAELTLVEMKEESELFDESIFDALDVTNAIERRDVFGGPAKARVAEAIKSLRQRIG